jgi:hypothetical protein
MFLWVLSVVLMTPWIEATAEIPGFDAAAKAPTGAGVTSCVQVKPRGKRGKGFSGSFLRCLVFGRIGFAGPNVIWTGFFLLG